jgi:hypothetical protein
MTGRIGLAATGVAVLLAGCGSASSTHHHSAASPSVAVSPTAPAPASTPTVSTAQSIKACKDVQKWLPRAWSQDPPVFTTRLVSDTGKTHIGNLGSDLSNLQGSVQGLSEGQYLNTTTGITPVKHDCSAFRVKIKVPAYNPAARCWARFRVWKNGPVSYEISSMARALSSFSKNSNSDLYAAVVFLHIAGTAAGLAQNWPMPACADPGRYWRKYLRDTARMGADSGSAAVDAGNGYLPDAAISAQQNAQAAIHNLTSELAQSTGHHPFG